MKNYIEFHGDAADNKMNTEKKTNSTNSKPNDTGASPIKVRRGFIGSNPKEFPKGTQVSRQTSKKNSTFSIFPLFCLPPELPPFPPLTWK